MSGSQNTQTQSTYYKPGYTTHGIKGGPGYHPYGKIGYIEPLQSIGHPEEDSGPVSRFTAVHRKLKKGQKAPYVGGHPIFNQERLEPGHYKLSNPYLERYNVENANSQIPYDPNFKYKFPEDMRHAVHIDEIATDAARVPHTWLRPEVEIDKAEDEMFDYFDNISSEALDSKKELLRLKGYSEAEINKAVGDLREKEIQKNLKSANIVSLPSITTPQSVITGNGGMAMARPAMTHEQALQRYGRQIRTGIGRGAVTTAEEIARMGYDPSIFTRPIEQLSPEKRLALVNRTTQRRVATGKSPYGVTTRMFDEPSTFSTGNRAFNISQGVRRRRVEI